MIFIELQSQGAEIGEGYGVTQKVRGAADAVSSVGIRKLSEGWR